MMENTPGLPQSRVEASLPSTQQRLCHANVCALQNSPAPDAKQAAEQEVAHPCAQTVERQHALQPVKLFIRV